MSTQSPQEVAEHNRRELYFTGRSDIVASYSLRCEELISSEGYEMACSKFVKDPASRYCLECGYLPSDHQRRKAAGLEHAEHMRDLLAQALKERP